MRAFLSRLWSVRRLIAFWVILLLIGWAIGHVLQAIVIPEIRPMNEPTIHKMMMGALFLYILMAAIPFVPGAEIGFGLLLLFGGAAAPVVYLGMIGALTLSYLVAIAVPSAALAGGLAWLGLKRTAALVRSVNDVPFEEREALLLNRLPSGVAQKLCKSRYVALALLINLPGNSVIGGGGGIAFAAGASGLYRFPLFFLTILVAVSPIPLFFYAMG